MTCHVKIRWFAYRRNYLTFHKGSSPLIQRFSPRTLVHPIFFEPPEEKKPPPLSLRIFSNILQSCSKSWPRERLINVANGQMEFWTIKDGVRRRGWKGWFLSLSLSLVGAGAAVEVVAASPRKNRRTKGKFRMSGTYLLSRRHVIRLWNGRRRMNQKETRSLNYRVWSS